MMIDNAHSEIGFKVRHLMISTVKGNFQTFNGGVDENGELTVTINVNSINTGNSDRDGHLKSKDFFNVEEFPTIDFKSSVDSLKTHPITGELTIKGITKEVVLTSIYNGKSVDPWGNTKHGWELSFMLNRNDYDLTWNTTLETGGVLVSEEVNITIDVQMMEVSEEIETESAS